MVSGVGTKFPDSYVGKAKLGEEKVPRLLILECITVIFFILKNFYFMQVFAFLLTVCLGFSSSFLF